MAQFFTSENDLAKWVSDQGGPEKASNILGTLVGDSQQDIIETCTAIYNGDENAAQVLFGLLGKHNLTGFTGTTNAREANMSDKIKKEAQTMRSGLYNNMPLRVCPKLPYSSGKRLISTFNCRENCLDSLVLDDDPLKTYCLETMWRRHVMDKFAREFKNDDGEWVGGYINERFHRFPDAGTPANQDVDRYQGNNMQVAHGDRTRKPREHQYSMEARLEVERDVEPIFHEAKKNGTIIRLADKSGSEEDKGKELDDNIYEIFNDMIEMKESGLEKEDIVIECSKHHNMHINSSTKIFHCAMRQMNRYDGKLYAYDASNKMTKTAESNDSKKKVVSEQATGISGEAKSVPVNQFAEAVFNNEPLSLPGGTILRSTNSPNDYIVERMNNPMEGLNGGLDLINQTVRINNPDLLVNPIQADYDPSNDQLILEGLPEANIDMDEATEAFNVNPEETQQFIQDQTSQIGPMNVPSSQPLAASTEDTITIPANEFDDVNQEVLAKRVEELRKAFANTLVDPNIPISEFGVFKNREEYEEFLKNNAV